MPDIFVSYASEDLERIQPLVSALEGLGWSVWWDRTMRAGQRYRSVIAEALAGSRCVVVVWTATSVVSDWVMDEVDEARRLGRELVPVLLEPVTIPMGYRQFHAVSSVEHLMRDVGRILGSVAVPNAAPPVSQTVEPEMVKVNPKDGLPYVWIPPNLEAKIQRGFWIGRTPVTQAAYRRVMGTNPSHFQGDNLPVESVSWNDAKAYCGKIGMRLPTQSEWEYAARAGATEDLYGELDRIAWYRANSDAKTHPVGMKAPNAWGLYDTLGNVWEWCGDFLPGKGRNLRGGAWYDNPSNVKFSDRENFKPSRRVDYLGFRCVGELG